MALVKFTGGSILAFLKSTDGSVLALLKSTDGAVLALLRLPSIFSCKNSTVGEFWCTMAIMKEKQLNFLFGAVTPKLIQMVLPVIKQTIMTFFQTF